MFWCRNHNFGNSCVTPLRCAGKTYTDKNARAKLYVLRAFGKPIVPVTHHQVVDP